jgi:glutamine amidotransferase
MIAVIDYKAGNLKSVELALNKVGHPCRVTADPAEVVRAERIVFPGVGAAGKAMEELNGLGLSEAISASYHRGIPILGICVGAQVILETSEENRATCLGLIRGRVTRFPPDLVSTQQERLKIPHMGWNELHILRNHPVLDGIRPRDEFYFVHSYYPVPAAEKQVLATTDYAIDFPSVIGEGNIIATQFHPEKSGPPGLRLLRNFCQWDGRYAE